MKEKLLLHVCCAPCATEVIRRLADAYDLTALFYNPNVFPEDEHCRRLAEFERLCALWHVQHDVGPYDREVFLSQVTGHEEEPEGGARCTECFRLRLSFAAQRAKENGCVLVASTLTIGRNKSASLINRLGQEECGRLGVRFLEADWKKQGGFLHSVALSRELGLYRQRYCGCEFSCPRP